MQKCYLEEEDPPEERDQELEVVAGIIGHRPSEMEVVVVMKVCCGNLSKRNEEDRKFD